MVHGAPFPSLYDWTMGELIEFIQCKREARKNELKEQAIMDFKLASLISRMTFGQQGQTFELMEEYDHLWTFEERAEAKRRQIESRFRVKQEK